jgi:hypothetical protein
MDVFIHQAPHNDGRRIVFLIYERVDPIRDARNTLNARKRGQGDRREKATHGYHPRHGGPYESAED